MTDYIQYIIAILAVIIAAILIKKTVSCLIRVIVAIILVGVLATLYFMYIN